MFLSLKESLLKKFQVGIIFDQSCKGRVLSIKAINREVAEQKAREYCEHRGMACQLTETEEV